MSIRMVNDVYYYWRWALIKSVIWIKRFREWVPYKCLLDQYLLTRLLTESLEYDIGDLKKNLTNSRSPAYVEDDKGS